MQAMEWQADEDCNSEIDYIYPEGSPTKSNLIMTLKDIKNIISRNYTTTMPTHFIQKLRDKWKDSTKIQKLLNTIEEENNKNHHLTILTSLKREHEKKTLRDKIFNKT